MINDRHITVELQGKKKLIANRKSSPQGGILFPFLKNLVINELLECTRDRIPIDLQGFADGLAMDLIVAAPRKPAGSQVQSFDVDTSKPNT